MNHSKTWIFVVLVSFIGLILPKDLWHHCKDMHLNESHQDQKSSHFSKDSSCKICDFHFFPSIENPFTLYAFTKISHPKLELLVNEFNLEIKFNTFLRGPPKCLIEA